MVGILLMVLPNIKAVGEVSFCCEKTSDGAWCQNAPEIQCSEEINPATGEEFRAVPTSCEATGYCKLGCCYDSQEGTCMENTPESVCNKEGGIYSRESASCDPNLVPQCSLGCCIIGDQAAFVTQVRCKRISALYGLETIFKTDALNELQCLASVTSNEKGACVFEKDFEKTCQLLTQKECEKLGQDSQGTNVEFHQGYLCSAEELGTNCGQTQKTTCVENKDEVYFLDSCGNIANIYDSSKIKDKPYWTKIMSKEESCGADSGNANSKSCGNCDYYLGSTCKNYDRKIDNKPDFGDKICRDLGCNDADFLAEYERQPLHGEAWCASNSNGIDTPGTEYFRFVCYNNDITIEPCDAYRQSLCVQSESNGGFKTAACVKNRWEDCIVQDNEKDCNNTDKRDCVWIANGDIKDNKPQYVCAPLIAPGFEFWNPEGTSQDTCSLASTECIAKFEKGLLEGTWECKENCQCCVDDGIHKGCKGGDWLNMKENFCQSLGDCGIKVNYIGEKGYAKIEEVLKCNGETCWGEYFSKVIKNIKAATRSTTGR